MSIFFFFLLLLLLASKYTLPCVRGVKVKGVVVVIMMMILLLLLLLLIIIGYYQLLLFFVGYDDVMILFIIIGYYYLLFFVADILIEERIIIIIDGRTTTKKNDHHHGLQEAQSCSMYSWCRPARFTKGETSLKEMKSTQFPFKSNRIESNVFHYRANEQRSCIRERRVGHHRGISNV